MRRPTGFAAIALILSLGAAWAVTPARGDYSVTINGNLSAVSPGTSGYLDFQFNVGNATGYDHAVATVTAFSEANLALNSSTDTGGGSGTLPGTLILDNATGNSEILEAVTIGANASFSFTLTFTGTALNAPSGTATAGTSFSLGVLKSSFAPLYGSSDPVLQYNINPNIATPALAVLVTPPITVASVPEPASIVLIALGLAGAWPFSRVVRRRRAR